MLQRNFFIIGAHFVLPYPHLTKNEIAGTVGFIHIIRDYHLGFRTEGVQQQPAIIFNLGKTLHILIKEYHFFDRESFFHLH